MISARARLVRADAARHPTPPALRAALEKTCTDLRDAPPEVVSMSVAFHQPHDAAAMQVVTTAEEIAADHQLDHLVHVRGDVYEIHVSRPDHPALRG